MPDLVTCYKRKLPHIQPKGMPLFVTIRSADPIPQRLLIEYQRYTEMLRASEISKPDDRELKHQNNKRAFARLDDMYHLSTGEIDFTSPASIPSLISDNLQAMQAEFCLLYAYTIIPNHVHLLLKPNERDGKPIGIAEIMRRFKGLTARQINLLMGRSGSLWSREYHDHWVRSAREFLNIVEYIRQNPVKAGLVKQAEDWPWT